MFGFGFGRVVVGGAGLFVIAVTGFWLALGCCVSCVLLLFILLLCGCISVSLY